MNKIDERFQRNAREMLDRIGWTDTRLADELKITPQSVHKMLKKMPKASMLIKLSKIFNCDPSDLVSEKQLKTAEKYQIEESLRVELYASIARLNEGEVRHVLDAFIRPLMETKQAELLKNGKRSS